MSPRDDEQRPPDIEVGGRARARTVRFDEEPETRVRYGGDYVAEEIHERENLPEEVEPEVTYRDVRVSWHSSVRVREEPPPE